MTGNNSLFKRFYSEVKKTLTKIIPVLQNLVAGILLQTGSDKFHKLIFTGTRL